MTLQTDFKNYLLEVTQASACKEVEIIQSLWSGYGKIARYELQDALFETVVVKHIAPKKASEHPRGWNTDFSHQRKLKSYDVETNWYQKWSEVCTDACRVPVYIGSFSVGADRWIVLEDLNASFPLRKQELNLDEVSCCLKWLAHFHAMFMNQKPDGLWEVGTYWHLATRPEEFQKMEHTALKAKAHLIDAALNQCQYQTIVHGDAKLANFCFSKNEAQVSEQALRVAAVDFQYAGGGCGMKDVAYFLGSCLTGEECNRYEKELLGFYFSELKQAIDGSQINFTALEDEWRRMYPIACADFTRFLLGWMPSHQKVNAYNLNKTNDVLSRL